MLGSLGKMQDATPLRRLGDVEDLGRLTAIFHVDGGIDSNNLPLPIPDY